MGTNDGASSLRAVIAAGIVVIAAAVALRLAVGRLIAKHLRQHYGDSLADEMARRASSPSVRIAAQAAMPSWLRSAGFVVYLALPVGIMVLIVGIVR